MIFLGILLLFLSIFITIIITVIILFFPKLLQMDGVIRLGGGVWVKGGGYLFVYENFFLFYIQYKGIKVLWIFNSVLTFENVSKSNPWHFATRRIYYEYSKTYITKVNGWLIIISIWKNHYYSLCYVSHIALHQIRPPVKCVS